MNEPEEMRQVERDAQKLKAELAADMLRRPSSRWAIRPIYKLMSWVERKAAEWLRAEGWR